MLFFMSVFGLPRDIDDILVVHRHQVIQQSFASLQEKANHERIALMIGEPLEVFGAVSFGLLEEVVEKLRG